MSRRQLALALALSWLLAGCALIDAANGRAGPDDGDDDDDGASDFGDGGDPGDFPDGGGPDAAVPTLFPTRDEVVVQGALGIAICDVTGDGQGDVLVSDDGRRISRLENGERFDLIAGLDVSFRHIVCAELNQNDTPDVIGINDDYAPPQLVLFLDFAGTLEIRMIAVNMFIALLDTVTVGDLDRDGLVDLATTGIDQVVLFQDPQGGGAFGSVPRPLPADGGIDRISIIDQDDADGNDLVFSQAGRFTLMKQTSTPGEFFPEQTLFEPRDDIEDVLVADLDGQARPEIIGGASDGPVILSPTVGDEFDVITTGGPDNFVSGRLAVGDATGDGLPEIVMTGYDVAIFRQVAPLQFDPLPERISSSSSQAAMRDVDGDGRADIALLSGSTVSLLLTRPSDSP